MFRQIANTVVNSAAIAFAIVLYSASASTQAADTTRPTAPTGLVATVVSSNQINLNWNASTDNVGVTRYQVLRCQGTNCSNFAQVGTSTGTSFNNTALTAATTYRYRVRSVDAAMNVSTNSNTVSASTDTTPPSAPSTLTALAMSASRIDLAWTASTDNVGATGYRVESCQGAGCTNFAQIATPTTTTFSNTGRSAGTNYSYRVRAVDAAGNLGPYSNIASATTLDTSPPTAPTNLAATVASTSQINLNWTASTDNVGVSGYQIDRCQGTGCTAFVQITTSTTTGLSDTGLAATTTYRYRVRATDAAGNVSTNSSIVTATTQAAPDTQAPTAPGTLTATAVSGSQINLAWGAATDNVTVTGYLVERCLTASCTYAQIGTTPGTATSYSDNTGLVANTGYSYRVRATDAVPLLGPYSNVASATTPGPDTQAPTVPTNLAAIAASTSQITLAWTAATDNVGVTGYRVERCQGAGCTNFAQIGAPTITSFNDTGLAAATTYRYQVRATDAAGNLSAYSSIASATTQTADTTAPTAPTNLAATASSAQINLAWTASTDNVAVTGYLVERCQGAGCSTFIQIAALTTPSLNNSGLSAGTSYSYRVRATDTAGNLSAYSNVASATTGAGLVAAYGFDEGSGTTLADASGNGYTGTLTNGPAWTTGKFGSALQFNASDDGNDSNDPRVVLGRTLNIPNLPLTISAWVNPTDYADYRAIISKRDSPIASNMRLDVGLSQTGGGVYIFTGSSYSFSYAPPLNSWTHLAVVADSSGTRLYVNGLLQQTIGVIKLGTNTSANTVIGGSGDGAGGDNDPFKGKIDDLRIYNRGLSQAEIQADMASPVGGTPPPPPDTTLPSAPTNLSATAASASQINLAWMAATDNVGVTGYRVERCPGVSCSSFAQIATPATTSFNDTGLSAGTSYSYQVRAVDATGNLGVYSNIASVTTPAAPDTQAPAAPTGLTAISVSTNQVNLSWTASTDNVGVSGYQIDRCQGTGCTTFVQITTSTTTGLSDTGLAATTTYRYQVRATDAAGNVSTNSNIVTATTQTVPDTTSPSAPSGLAAIAASGVEISLAWTAATDDVGVTGYRVERCQGAGCTNFAQIATPTITSVNDTGLTASTSYSYRVLATDAAGNLSGYSNVASATTSPPGPTVSLAANPTSVASGGSATLTWSSTDATSCLATGAWTGGKATSGSETPGPLTTTSTFTLSCSGAGGSANQSVTVTVPVASAIFGLDFPGDDSARRMLFWHNPFPIYDATYIFKVYPRRKASSAYKSGYYTTFFWGNDGRVDWDTGPYRLNTYYGAHPYPVPSPDGPGQWEISVALDDIVTGSEVEWNRWYTQAFRAWRESASITHHEFYWDLPDTSKVLTWTVNNPAWANKNPPVPAIVMGQTPNVGGGSWGGYPGWEEFNGIIRGIQFYSGLLSVADIQSEIATPMSTSAGQSLIWYLNLNPRPSDVTDKKGTGTAHDPSWDGTALEWAQ